MRFDDLPAGELAGHLLVVGFDGTSVPAALARELHDATRAGVILFRRNLPDVETTRALTGAIAALGPDGAPPLFIAVDEEGGRVSRLPAPEPKLPPARVFGDAGDVALARDGGRAIGARLAELGFNWDFAPILDVDSNPQNPVIGDRAYSSDPARVATLGLAFAAGLAEGGVLACGKHFPGHGDTDTDSHLALPRVAHPRARLDAVELAPFRAAAAAGLESLMTAHVVLSAIDGDVPATLSPRVMTDLLRGELGYRGVLVSDDLEMRAVADRWGVAEAAVLAIRAGCDVVLVCKSAERAAAAHAALTREIDSSPAFRTLAAHAARRPLRLPTHAP
jgi:beta-N-acetylhexosaminidase